MDKKHFLKLMGGLSLGLLPLIGCFNQDRQDAQDTGTTPGADGKDTASSASTTYPITDDDLILLRREDAAFHTYTSLYNKRIIKVPAYIAVCKTHKGIQYAIQRAKKEQLPIAIRSGGHSFEGFSANGGGMVINVALMKDVQFLDNHTIKVQAGNTLSDLHEKVYAQGHLIPAGSCGGVGISGLALGGGYGFFSRKYGLTCDTIVDATLITADEKIIQAKDHPELLWALKGGGNGSYGVVTDLTFRSYPAPSSFSSHTFKYRNLDAARFTTLLKTWFDCCSQLPPEGFGAFVLNGRTLTALFTSYNGIDITQAIASMSQLADSSTSSLNRPLVPALKRFYGRKEPLFFKNASCGYYNSFNDIGQYADTLFSRVISNKGIILQINTLGGAINTISEQASAYPHRNQQYLGELQAYYDTATAGYQLEKGFEEIQQLFRAHGITRQYANYPDINFPDWSTAYFGNNYQQLTVIKKTYDPDNIFRHAQSIKVSSNDPV